MLRLGAGLAAVLVAVAAGMSARATPSAPEWHRSRPLGLPHAGALARGVRLPAEGRNFFTWDPVRKSSPNRAWRRFGTDRLLRTLLTVVAAYARAHPEAPRVGIGDLSRPRGGDFGVRYGLPGHVSHQNGLDADVYYPRRDGRERPPTRPAQIDLPLARDLLRRFLGAGAQVVFVGPRTGLRGPRRRVQALAHHDNHMHVRLPGDTVRRVTLGRSLRGRPLRATVLDEPATSRAVLVVGCVHGDECAGSAVAVAALRRAVRHRHVRSDLVVVPNMNPDGSALAQRGNARGVDLNRNFPAGWRARPPGDPEYGGRRPLSEPEARALAALVRRFRPSVTVWFHQPQGLVRAWGRSVRAARRYARVAGLPFRALPWLPGSAPQWQNRRFTRATSFVVELPPGRLGPAERARHVAAVLALAK